MKKKAFILFSATVFFLSTVYCQRPGFSIATDLDLQRSFKKEQRYWAVGQAVQAHFNFSPKEGIYSWISYYSDGKFNNDLVASAKLAATNPQQINYTNNAEMRFKHFSIGWKHYFKGAYNSEDSWNLYGYAGFGLLMGRVINNHSVIIDSNLYNIPVRNGKSNFKRLTLDLGLGWEEDLGGNIYFYNEARLWIPTTDYPSKYIFVNKDAPLVASLNFGIRILF